MIPGEITRWIEQAMGGRVAGVKRHVARREAWVVNLARGEKITDYFVRIDRHRGSPDAAGVNPQNLDRETAVLRALAGTEVSVPRVHAWNPELFVAVLELLPGRPDLHNVSRDEQQPVFEHFMQQLAALHTLPPERLELPGFESPGSAEASALREVEKFAATFGGVIEPLLTFGMVWLRRHVPAYPQRISLLQGDTGPANFMFEDGRVTGVVDWEFAHLGDPMEDLGNVCIREFYHPSGNLAELFPIYEKASGIPLDFERIRYFRVENNVRAVFALQGMTTRPDPAGPLAMNLAYRCIQERAICEAIAAADGIELRRPELPAAAKPTRTSLDCAPSVPHVVAQILRDEVMPTVSDDYARHRLEHAGLLVECLARRQDLGAAVARVELDELHELMDRRFTDLAEGLVALNRAIETGQARNEEALLGYLARRAYRAESLHAPVVALFPDRKFSPIE